jgi:NADH-quinone oxidoreductase subunit L
MFIAVGMRAYAVALFFLVAHAFYKALMFLGAGSVIHGVHGEQDMRVMGGLRKLMPMTFVTFMLGGLAQAGIPPLAGFFAKDALLEVANHSGRQAVYVLATITAFLTAFYIGRMLIFTFFGSPRSERAEHAHESPPVMWVPLAILAVGVVVIGPLEASPDGLLSRTLSPLVGELEQGQGLGFPQLAGLAVLVAVLALAAAWWIYGSRRADPQGFRTRMEPWATAAQHGWFVDRAYDAVLIQPSKTFAWLVADVFDRRVVDGAVNGVAVLVQRVSTAGRFVQTGFVRTYAVVLFLGAVALLGYIGYLGVRL